MSLTRTLARGACVAVAGLGAQVALADSISPTSYSASIGVGGTATVEKTVKVTKEVTSSKLDIFFLADTTGSMGSAITSVKTNAASLLTTTAGYGDVQWEWASTRTSVTHSYTARIRPLPVPRQLQPLVSMPGVRAGAGILPRRICLA